jgi:putative transposase
MKTIQPLEHSKYYHIYNRGIDSDILFKEISNFEHFLRLYDQHIEPIAETYAWCLMRSHFHFLVRIKGIDEIPTEKKIQPSQSFSNLFNAYTRAFNKSYKRHGTLFERPFKRKEINSDNYFKNLIIYIHNNPVNHSICEHPISYPWSSYMTCLSSQPTRLKREEVIDVFNDPDNFKYMHQRINRENFIESFYE